MCGILNTLLGYFGFLIPTQEKEKEVKKTLLDWYDEHFDSKRNGRNFYPLKISSIKSIRGLLSSKGILNDFTEERGIMQIGDVTEERGIHDILFGNSKLFSEDEFYSILLNCSVYKKDNKTWEEIFTFYKKKTLLDWFDTLSNQGINPLRIIKNDDITKRDVEKILSSKGICCDFTETGNLKETLFGNSKLFSKDEFETIFGYINVDNINSDTWLEIYKSYKKNI